MGIEIYRKEGRNVLPAVPELTRFLRQSPPDSPPAGQKASQQSGTFQGIPVFHIFKISSAVSLTALPRAADLPVQSK